MILRRAISLLVFHCSGILRNCCRSNKILISINRKHSYAEAHISTQPPPSRESSRLPGSHGLQSWSCRVEPPSRQGPSQDRRLRRLPRLVRDVVAGRTGGLSAWWDRTITDEVHEHPWWISVGAF